MLVALLVLAPILANDRVAVWDAKDLAPREHDSVVVEFDTASARLVPKGAPLKASGRAIDIELLAPPVGPLPNSTGLPSAFERPGIERLLDDPRFTVWRYQWRPGVKTPMHFHANDVVVTYLADGVLASTTADGKTSLNPHSYGMTKFSPRGRAHFEELAKGEARAVMVELK
ncbi:MAG TPA: hypothetical protein VLW85_23505 [Myxococcales bacterium]|nr:hypothetical protein [Myxococcales bacterium]